MIPEVSNNLVENSTMMEIGPSLSIFRFTYADIMENSVIGDTGLEGVDVLKRTFTLAQR